jgi:hypothetical protein
MDVRRGVSIAASTAMVLALVLGLNGAAGLPRAAAASGQGQENGHGPGKQNKDSGAAVQYDASAPLGTLTAPPDPADDGRPGKEHHDRRDDQLLADNTSTTPDPVAQSGFGPAAAPTATTFEGLGAGFTGPQGTMAIRWVPSDENIAVGPNAVVEMVNTSFAVFDKSGAAIYGPVNDNTVFAGFGGPCESTNDGDPVVRYDRLADRWLLTQFANVNSSSGPYYECLAVSQTNDPLGSYYRYAFQYAQFDDYPKVGVWPDGYYVSFNMFNGGTLAGGEVCALDRTSMLSGQAATQQCFSTSLAGLLPSDVDGPTPPPSGEANTVVALGSSNTTLAAWRFHVDWATPANSTLTGPADLSVATYSEACDGGQCVPQADVADTLDSLADRLMYRLAYRNLGDHESFVVTHAVTAPSGIGVRWYELRLSSGNVSVYQQGTYAPDGNDRWMSSAAMDGHGSIALGFSLSGPALYPSVHYTGRLAGDALGQMTQGEGTVIDGAGSQQQGSRDRNRWGDYSSMEIDPADDCTFWYVNDYLPATATTNWHTRIGSFSLPGCMTAPANDFSLAPAPWTGTATQGETRVSTVSTGVTKGSAESIVLSASGLPTGATATFSPASVPAGAASTMTFTTDPTTPVGTYTVVVKGTSPSATHTRAYTLTVKRPPSYLTVNDPSVLEGNTGTKALTFTVTRSGDTSAPATVLDNTVNGSAQSGTDYAAIPTTQLSFGVGETAKTVAVTVDGDVNWEPDETLFLHLSSPSAGTAVSDADGVGTIKNDDPAAFLSVNDVSVLEGNSGTKTATFRITRTGGTTGTTTVNYFTSNGSAVGGTDYVAIPTTPLTFAPGDKAKTVAVTVNGDTTWEPDDIFFLRLSSTTGGIVADDTGVGTIKNDDPISYLAVKDVNVVEGDSGTANAVFRVVRTGSTAAPATVSWSTGNGSALAGTDYTAVPWTTLSFAAGQAAQTVSVPVSGDTTWEPDETFVVRLTSAVGAVISDDTGVATIKNDDPISYLSVNDVTLTEGNSGTTDAVFTVTRSGDTAAPVTVNYSTSNGSAQAGTDFVGLPTTQLSFAAGETAKTVTVVVDGDTAAEANETFSLRLSSPVGAALADDTGMGTIVDDDGTSPAPGPSTFFSVADLAVAEGNSGTAGAVFTVTRSGDTSGSSSVSWFTGNGSAQAGSDYVGVGSTALSFGPGETAKTVTVTVDGDTTWEADETFFVRLASPVGGVLSDDTAVGTILNDDGVGFLSVGDVTLQEGNSGTKTATFTITRTGSLSGSASVNYFTSNGSALAGSDYEALPSTTVTFAPTETAKQVSVTIDGDSVWEPDEYFFLRLSSPVGAVVSDDTALGTVKNDDAAVFLSVNDLRLPEGSTGSKSATFRVTRSGDTSAPVSVAYFTQNGTALAGTDYTGVGGTPLSFAAGETAKTVTVTVAGDTTWEPDEWFFLRLSAPVGAALSDDSGMATVLNDDAAPFIRVDDVSLSEGNSGTVNAVFTVTRTGYTSVPASVNYWTTNGTAAAGSDYTGLATTPLSFAAGETAKTVTVLVTSDTLLEPDEMFSLRLAPVSGAVVVDDTGVATIENDD